MSNPSGSRPFRFWFDGRFLFICSIDHPNWFLWARGYYRLAEEDENHQGHGDDGEEGGNGDQLGGFDIVAAVFGGEEAEWGGGGEGLDESADLDYFNREMESGE